MKKHYLKHSSSYTVVVLRSLRHGACVNCGEPIKSLDESYEHWDKKLEEDSRIIMVKPPPINKQLEFNLKKNDH